MGRAGGRRDRRCRQLARAREWSGWRGLVAVQCRAAGMHALLTDVAW
jgi:hypothetical protein